MKAHMTRPCENCPYRMDAPRRLWHRSEFERLLNAEQRELGSTYACHKQGDRPKAQRGFCAGWALDQKRRGIPSIAFRLILNSEPDARAAFEALSADGLELFPSVEAMCRANGVIPSHTVRGRR